MIKQAKASGITKVKDVHKEFNVDVNCGSCLTTIKQIMEEEDVSTPKCNPIK
jgi:bacterioferritin-associated ferredoxin